jgi:hypothetical protein
MNTAVKDAIDDTHYMKAGLSEPAYLILVNDMVNYFSEVEQDKEALQSMLEKIGYRVGQRLVER